MQTTLRIVSDAKIATSNLTVELSRKAEEISSGNGTAAELMGEVSKVLSLLSLQCETSERTLLETQQRTQADLAQARQQVEHWRKLALSLRVKLNRLTNDLPSWQKRAEAAERHVEITAALTRTAQRAFAETEAVAALFPVMQASVGERSGTEADAGLPQRLATLMAWMASLRTLATASHEASAAIAHPPVAA